MNTLRGLLLVICAVIFSAIALAACGGDDDEENPGNGSEATETLSTDSSGDSGSADEPTDAADPTDEPDDGDNGGGGGAADTSEACSLLTKSEVEDSLGVSILDPELISLPDIPISGGAIASVASCSFVAADATDSVSLTVTSAPDDESGIGAMIDLACQNKDEISGLGDKACWYSEAHTEIQMKVGATFVDLFLTTVTGDSTEIMSALAERVADRLS